MTMIHHPLAAVAGETVLKSSRKLEHTSEQVKSSPCAQAPKIAYDDIRIGRLLGKGGFNDVHEVFLPSKDESNANRYAIKYLRDSAGAADLVNESKVLQHLQHENIIKLHGISESCVSKSHGSNRRFFLILDRLSCSLADKIKEWRFDEQKLSPSNSSRVISVPQMLRLHDRLSSVAIPIVNSLHYLHTKNILFRDLKPANIGFDANGIVKLFDFGLAREVKEEGRRMTGNIGSPLWMAPEVALSKKYGFPADIYSLAYILWELTTLETPFQGVTREQHAKYILVENVRPKVDSRCGSPRIQQLIIGGWDRSPLSRPGLNEFLSVLKSETAGKLGPD